MPIPVVYYAAMNADRRTIYPDTSDILARKAERRRELARLPYGEKIDIVERMRERLAPIKRAREERRARRKERGDEG